MKPTRIAVLALTLFALLGAGFAQAPANAPNPGKYGLTGWAINNQRVASQYNYYIDSTFQTAVGGAFTFPSKICAATLNFGANRNVGAFNSNASVKIIDVNSANTETVSGVAPTYSGGSCTLPFSTSNTHTAGSYILRSGTCGLREALNDLGGNGGEVIVDQRFYDDGCTAATITGLAATALQANQFVHDISNGQDTYYFLKANTNAASATPTVGAISNSGTGGTIAAATYRVAETCVDPLGGESLISSDTSSTTTTSGSTSTITVAPPTGCTAATTIGYRLYISAAAGGQNSEILYAPSAAGCTATPQSVVVSACALTSSSVVTALVTSTAGIPLEATGHTGVGYLASGVLPPAPGMQIAYGPFAAITSVTTVQTGAEVPIPAGFFNTGVNRTYRVCAQGVGTAAAATIAGTFKLQLGPRSASAAIIADTVNFTASTIWPAAAANWSYCTYLTTTTTGTSGTVFATSDTGFIVSTTAAAAPPAFGPQLDNTTANSSTVDLTQQQYLDFLFTATASSWTTLTVNKVTITAVD